ncbi:MAG TPA: metallophosphatase [Paludibacteraceae bacterium]|nr:metallophosphatase [Paludibacteraceae bacterium]HQB68703.1 metallophosphatase [Paludibacteraceae bacterium]HRS67254.1 metallophosphatase [Paludibacteraceae bacterium]
MLKNKNVALIIIGAIVALSACTNKAPKQLLILHTNDSHSQVEATKDGFGGFAARAALIDSFRAVNPNLLLLDAGDIFQGTPYFNMFDGRLEIDAYNKMGYEAATLGNHEFDKGIDTLAARIRQANFPFVCTNYEAEGTALEGLLKRYTVIKKDGLKVGILGLGVDPHKLILETYFGGLTYIDPIESANRYAEILKNKEKCDFVIVLSHLGYSSNPDVMSDSILAINSRNIDLVLGGHTHDIRGVFHINNLDGKSVSVMQAGKSAKEITVTTVEY